MKRPISLGSGSPERERLEKVQAALAKRLGVKPKRDDDQKRQGEASIDGQSETLERARPSEGR